MLSSTKLSNLPSYQKGEQKGLARSLRYLLEQKFGGALPDSLEQRLQTANDEQLLLWLGRVLQANNLNEVFI